MGNEIYEATDNWGDSAVIEESTVADLLYLFVRDSDGADSMSVKLEVNDVKRLRKNLKRWLINKGYKEA